MTSQSEKTILITGGLGFIGSRLASRLLKQNPDQKIRVLDNFSVGSISDLARSTGFNPPNDADIDLPVHHVGPIEVMRGDIRIRDDLAKAMDGCETIVHLAAQTGVPISVDDPMLDFETNVVSVVNLLDIARTFETKPKIVFSSSNAPLGRAVQPVSEATVPSPIAPYGASKLAGENYLKAFGESFNIPSVSLRFGNVYGPGSSNKSSVVAKFIRRALNGERLEIYGDGSATRDFIHIDDLLDAVMKSIDFPVEGAELFQISAGAETDIRTLTETLCAAFEKRGINRPDIAFEAERHGDMKRNVSDVAKARDVLGWSVQRPLEEGILETLDWFLAQK